MKSIYILVMLIMVSLHGLGQEGYSRIESIRGRLEMLAVDVPALNNSVTTTVSDITLYEFLRAIGVKNKLNLDVDQSLNSKISSNFDNVSIIDLLVYLSEQQGLEILPTGNIISIVKFLPPAQPPVTVPPRILNISYDTAGLLLSFDLQKDTLSAVIREIGIQTGRNVIVTKQLHENLVSGIVKSMEVTKAIQELANINGLVCTVKDSATFYFADRDKVAAEPSEVLLPKGMKLVTNKADSIISIFAVGTPLKDVLAAVASELSINYYVFSELKGTADLKVENLEFDKFLKYLFNGTEYTFKVKNGLYLIGDRRLEEIRTAEVYKLRYRTVLKIIEQIPSELKKNVEVIALPELNSLVISGSNPAVNELKDFLRQIDKTVPVVNIELIILDIRRSHSIATGIMAGLDKDKAVSSYANVFPTLDVTLSANTLNNLISGITGANLINLGTVTPQFYVSLKASEDNGSLKIRSTPRLSTLNGNEAQMSIGETRYYSEQTTNVITTQSTTTVTGRIFKELQANFGITIKPIVSGDEQITLDISVEQSTFTEQFTKDGPYGRLTRSFKSSIRARNNDIILLGGLEEKNTNNAGQGIPILSRLPIIKWIFSSRSASSKKSKLAILIHPTVFY